MEEFCSTTNCDEYAGGAEGSWVRYLQGMPYGTTCCGAPGVWDVTGACEAPTPEPTPEPTPVPPLSCEPRRPGASASPSVGPPRRARKCENEKRKVHFTGRVPFAQHFKSSEKKRKRRFYVARVVAPSRDDVKRVNVHAGGGQAVKRAA